MVSGSCQDLDRGELGHGPVSSPSILVVTSMTQVWMDLESTLTTSSPKTNLQTHIMFGNIVADQEP